MNEQEKDLDCGCSCGDCGCDCDHDHDDMPTVTLTLDDDTVVECLYLRSIHVPENNISLYFHLMKTEKMKMVKSSYIVSVK